MAEDFCRTVISATTKEEADKISDALLTAKLVAGCLIIKGPARYLVEGQNC